MSGADSPWAAFEAEAMPHLDRLFRLAMWMERDRQEAEDLVQETMVQALKSFHRFTLGTNCKAWLVTILHHVRSNRRRARMRRPEVEDPDDRIAQTVPADPPIPQQVTDEDMLAALRGIPEAHQDIILLCDVEGMTYKEIAEALAIPIGTVMSRLHRGRALLRVQLKPATSEQILMSADQQPLSDRVRTAFERGPDGEVSSDFRASLTRRLREDAAAVTEAPAPIAVARRPWMAIAAGVLLVLGVGAGVQGWLTAGRFNLLARLAAGDHQNCAIKFALDEKPISLAEAASRYDPAFGRLEQVSPVPGSTSGPITVLERHSCVYRGRPFAHIVLAYKDQVVSVLVADAGAVGNQWWRGAAARELPSADPYQMASFRTADHIVFVVSSLSLADVDAVAQSMIRPVTDALPGG